LLVVSLLVNMICLLSLVCHMFPGGNRQNQGGGGGHPKLPPAWGPHMESHYPFKKWSRDLIIWAMILGDGVDASRQAAMIVSVLTGTAQELTQDMPLEAIQQGGVINGRQVDPVTYLMHLLAERYSQLGEESRLSAMTELMNFHRRGNEKIDDLLIRFDVIRQRAREQGALTMGIEGLTWILLRACHVNDQQLLQLLQPFDTRFPTNDVQFRQLYAALRRMGHILEHRPGNLAQLLHAQHGSNRFGAYMFSQNDWNQSSGSWPLVSSNEGWGMSQPSSWGGGAPAPTYTSWGATPANNPPFWENPQWSGSSWTPAAAYAAVPMDNDSGTDSDTESSIGATAYVWDDVQGSDANETAENLFWAYQHAKGRYRRFLGKPVRRVRRFFRRKGKGKGKSAGHYLSSLSEPEILSTFFSKGPKGRGKSKGKYSSGKGFGRRKNPKGPDGQIMTCRGCGSDEHFIKNCSTLVEVRDSFLLLTQQRPKEEDR